jgi:hypothetical protein
MSKRPDYITLDEMDRYFGDPEPMPSIKVEAKRFNILDLFTDPQEKRQTEPTSAPTEPIFDEVVQRELSKTFDAVRAGRRPTSVMHALALRDGLDIPRLSAIINQDVLDVAVTTEHLVAAGLVKEVVDTDGYSVFSAELGA